ncbi:hypothetical protein LWI29_001550 [Acer saccharum]|uniref:Uncharacterized protein n=1 Tax=Acer saccharum TaxID=4024 RepID=A0AA39VAG5_ACESA|nr:hypothetical protein LWI29_001550 [Acer saccharum]
MSDLHRHTEERSAPSHGGASLDRVEELRHAPELACELHLTGDQLNLMWFDECGTVGVNNSIVWMSVGVNNFAFPYLNPDRNLEFWMSVCV